MTRYYFATETARSVSEKLTENYVRRLINYFGVGLVLNINCSQVYSFRAFLALYRPSCDTCSKFINRMIDAMNDASYCHCCVCRLASIRTINVILNETRVPYT